MDSLLARKMWRTLEPYHGLVYFAPEAAAAYDGARRARARRLLRRPRSAPMGAVPAEVVIATFFNFNPDLVHHAIPAAWEATTPAAAARGPPRRGRRALRRTLGDLLDDPGVARAAELARTATDACTVAGRPLYAGHASLPWPDAPPLALWHAISLLREFRGDGHIACLVEAGLDGIEALVVHAASGEVPGAVLQASRGWGDDAWAAAVAGLAARGHRAARRLLHRRRRRAAPAHRGPHRRPAPSPRGRRSARTPATSCAAWSGRSARPS